MTDWEEVDTSRLIWHNTNSFEVPTIIVSDIVKNIDRFKSKSEYKFLLDNSQNIKYLPILSDPTDADTDDDGLKDDIDHEPLKKAYIKAFGTDEYQMEIEGKAKEGKYVREWYMTPQDLMARNINNYFNGRSEDLVSKSKIAKAAIDAMMQDVNECEQYLYTISDENWLKFCLFFNECVNEYGTVDENLHYFRIKLNRAPATLDEMIKAIEKDKSSWVLCTIWETRYHMTGENGEYNLKFVSSNSTNNIFEAVYDKNGMLLTEKNCPKNMGTYNYAGTKTNNSLHHKFDVDTYCISLLSF